MDRMTFTETLRRLSPALSKKDLVPVFSCFCFDGKMVHAYDDVVAIETEFEFPVPGAYRGDLLLQWANSVKGKEVVVEKNDGKSGEVSFGCGRSTISMPQIPSDNFLFERPQAKKEQPISITDDVVAAIARVLPCCARDSTNAWMHGVTMSATQKALRFFTTNDKSSARTSLPARPKGMEPGDTILLPPRFCDLLVELGRTATLKSFVLFGQSAVKAVFDNGVSLYTKLSVAASVEEYNQLFSKEAMEAINNSLQPVPSGFVSTVERASLVLDRSDAHTLSLSISDGRLTVHGKSSMGEVKDILKLPDHTDAKGDLDPDYLKPVIDQLEFITLLAPDRFVGQNETTTYIFGLVHDSAE